MFNIIMFIIIVIGFIAIIIDDSNRMSRLKAERKRLEVEHQALKEAADCLQKVLSDIKKEDINNLKGK